MEERLRTFCYSLFVGAVLTPAAGWIGAIFFPELTVMFVFVAAIAFLGGSFASSFGLLVTPAIFGIYAGSWVVTLLALPIAAQILHNRPALLMLTAPFIGAILGFITVTLTAKLTGGWGSELMMTRFQISASFAGFCVGAIFGRRLFVFLRD